MFQLLFVFSFVLVGVNFLLYFMMLMSLLAYLFNKIYQNKQKQWKTITISTSLILLLIIITVCYSVDIVSYITYKELRFLLMLI